MNILPTATVRVGLLLWLCIPCADAAINGPQTAQLINSRYRLAASTCLASLPAWHCNGVMVKTRQPDTGQTFWQHDANATALGAEGLVYLRKDLGIRQLPQANGAVFDDELTADSKDKSLKVLCAYPFTQDLPADRADYGCALTTPAATADVSSCPALGVTDSTGWLAHFRQSGNQPAQQCSLSSLDPPQFDASLKAHRGLGNEWAQKANRVQVSNWDARAPGTVPVQALFYDINQTGALIAAQRDQRDYFNATGEWLAVLRMDLNDSAEQVFGFSAQDQLYAGYKVASDLNARYTDTRPVCPNQQAAYFCNGVLIRGTAASPDFRAWNPSPNSVGRNGVSFSYIRADTGIVNLAVAQGITMKASSAPALYPLTLRCGYPVNAGTSAIPDSCRISCEQQNIVTVQAWRNAYGGAPGSSCAFTASPAQFQLSIEVRTALSAAARASWNEPIIAAWPQDIPARIPLESLFYTTPASLTAAQFIQRDYFGATGRFLPIVKLTLAQIPTFSYTPGDQSN